MPRYNITLSSAHNNRSPRTIRAWATGDDAAISSAITALGLANVERYGRPEFDTWEVWVGMSRNLPHRVIGRGNVSGSE